jgi:hypothetical protein
MCFNSIMILLGRRSLALIITFSALLTGLQQVANAAGVAGKGCKHADSKSIDSSRRALLCLLKNKKLVWVLQTQTGTSPNSQPNPQPSNSPTSPNIQPATCSIPPIFTHDFIDPKYIRDVTPIGQQTGGGGVISVRSYVHPSNSYAGIQLPIYAPTDMKFVGASYYKPFNAAPDYKPEYSLYFELGCDYALNLFHIKGVVGDVALRVPKETSSSSASQAVSTVAIKAGTQIGWYELGENSVAFDFWVDNRNHSNEFIVQSHFLQSNAIHSVCPYDFYTPEKKAIWLAKLGAPGSDPIPGTPCGVVTQGVIGSADGMWFISPETKTDVLTFDGPYQSQIMLTKDASGTVRIGGLAAGGNFQQIFIGRESPTYAIPADIKVGQSHCWSDPTQSVQVTVITEKSMQVVVGNGSCSALANNSTTKIYYR